MCSRRSCSRFNYNIAQWQILIQLQTKMAMYSEDVLEEIRKIRKIQIQTFSILSMFKTWNDFVVGNCFWKGSGPKQPVQHDWEGVWHGQVWGALFIENRHNHHRGWSFPIKVSLRIVIIIIGDDDNFQSNFLKVLAAIIFSLRIVIIIIGDDYVFIENWELGIIISNQRCLRQSSFHWESS